MHKHWIERPASMGLMIWLGVIEARRLYAELGEEVFVQFLREELSAQSGGNYARWWRKYGKYVGAE